MTNTATPENTALVIIDIQVGMIDPTYEHHQQVLDNIGLLLEKARSTNTPIIYVQHDGPEGHGLAVGSDAWQIHPAIAPQAQDAIVHKRASDAFHKTTLQAELQQRGIQRLVVAGGQTDFCVDTTVRRATTFGYNVTLASDAHLTFNYDTLTEAQIVAFYNEILNYFATEDASIQVKPTNEIAFHEYSTLAH